MHRSRYLGVFRYVLRIAGLRFYRCWNCSSLSLGRTNIRAM